MNYYYFFIIIFLLACSDKRKTQSEYYDSGELKSMSYYHRDSEGQVYLIKLFDKEGVLTEATFFNREGQKHGFCFSKEDNYKMWANYKNGKREGTSFVKFENDHSVIQHSKNDSIYGVNYWFDSENELYSEVVWLKERPLFQKTIHKIKPGDTVIYEHTTFTGREQESKIFTEDMEGHNYIAILPDSSTVTMGNFIINHNNDTVLSSYIKLYAADTIKYGDALSVTLQGKFGNLNNLSWDVFIENPRSKKKDRQMALQKPVGQKGLNLRFIDYESMSFS